YAFGRPPLNGLTAPKAAVCGTVWAGLFQHRHRLNFDQRVGRAQLAGFDDRAFRCVGRDVLPPDVDVFRERLLVGDVGQGTDDVGLAGARRLQARLDVAADLLDLCPQIALTDQLAVRVER